MPFASQTFAYISIEIDNKMSEILLLLRENDTFCCFNCSKEQMLQSKAAEKEFLSAKITQSGRS